MIVVGIVFGSVIMPRGELISKVVEINDAGGREGVSFQLEKITP